MQVVAFDQGADAFDVFLAPLGITFQILHQHQAVQRRAFESEVGTNLPHLPIGRMGIEVMSIGADRIEKIGKGPYLVFLVLVPVGRNQVSGRGKCPLSENRVALADETRRAPAAFFRSLGQRYGRRNNINTL